MKTVKKIAIVGSPGSGKSTLCAGIFYNLKILGEHVEMVPELIKYKFYKNLRFDIDGFDVQNTLEQKEFEETFETEKALAQLDYIICEAPLCNGYFYSSYYKKDLESPILKKIAQNKINSYDLIIFVQRSSSSEYITFGRKESLDQARELENHVHEKIKELGYKNKIMIVSQETNIKEVLKEMGIEESKINLLK